MTLIWTSKNIDPIFNFGPHKALRSQPRHSLVQIIKWDNLVLMDHFIEISLNFILFVFSSVGGLQT